MHTKQGHPRAFRLTKRLNPEHVMVVIPLVQNGHKQIINLLWQSVTYYLATTKS